jgi:hypothetical protein
MVDEAFGHEEPCEVCGKMPDDCICPECPDCGEYGNPHCYDGRVREFTDRDGDVTRWEHPSHGMVRTPEQVASKAAADKL